MGPIGPIPLIGQVTHLLSGRLALAPQRQSALAQEVFEVEQKFFQAGARDAYELQLEFLRSARGLAALGNILTSAARGLNHLIVSSRALVDEPIAKLYRRIVDELGLLEGLQLAIAAMRRNEVG